MNIKTTTLGTFAYLLGTFPLAILWHIVLFESEYHTFGYFEGEPNIVLGFLTILIQGFILSTLYPYFTSSSQGIVRGLKYSLSIGAFFWTSHVLAFIAKQEINGALQFMGMESFYLLLQFGLFGVLIGMIHGKTK